jgi:acetolactate synthase-1/2/3 large subunit
VGSRLGDWSTNGWTQPIVGTRATFQIDRDPWLIGRSYPVTLGIVGDAAAALWAIEASLPLDVSPPRRAPVGGIRRIEAHRARSNAVPLEPARVMAALEQAFPDAFFACDIGEHCAYALHYLTIQSPDQFRTMVGLASMGSGIGVAIGARHAKSDRRVVAICGDGGFLMYAGEVLTCVENEIDVVFVVLNDGRYNMIHHGFATVFGRSPSILPSRTADLAGVARELGAIGACVRTPEDLEPARLRGLAGSGRPVVLDVRIDPTLSLSANTRSAALKKLAFGGVA